MSESPISTNLLGRNAVLRNRDGFYEVVSVSRIDGKLCFGLIYLNDSRVSVEEYPAEEVVVGRANGGFASGVLESLDKAKAEGGL